VTTQTALLTAEHEVSERLKLDASAGAGLTGAAEPFESPGPSFLGGVGLSGRARRSSYDLRYGRSTYQAFGFGRNYLTDYASAFLEHQVAERFSVRVEARYRKSRESLLGRYAFTSQLYGASARYRIERRTLASAYYYFRGIDRPDTGNDVDSSVWGFAISYARSWKP
jgi:hypothetical protein